LAAQFCNVFWGVVPRTLACSRFFSSSIDSVSCSYPLVYLSTYSNWVKVLTSPDSLWVVIALVISSSPWLW
jgi:hypothetical protein